MVCTLQQGQSDPGRPIATLLLVAAESETGLRSANRALTRPDRRGLTTSAKEQTLGEFQALYDAGVHAIFGPGSNIPDAASQILQLIPGKNR